MSSFRSTMINSNGLRRGCLATAVVILAGFAPIDARAQEQSGAIVGAVTAVDGAGNAMPGCGGVGAGNNLTTLLNAVTGTPGFDDEGVGIAQRRTAFRFCDIQTATGAQGWTGDAVADASGVSAQAVALAPEEMFATMDDANSVFDLQTGNVARRVSMIRLARARRAEPNRQVADRRMPRPDASLDRSLAALRSDSPLSEADQAENLLLALQEGINAGDENGSGLGYFLNGRVHIVKGDENEAERGSEGTGGGFTLGVDQRLNDSAYLGAAFGYTRIATQYDGSASETDLDAVTVSLYGAWFATDELYVDGSVTAGWLGFDVENQLVIADNGPPPGVLQGSTDGVNVGFDVGVGYALALEEGLNVEPFLRVNLLYTEIDDFTQKGGDNTLNLDIDSQDALSVTASAGFRTEYAISTKFGVLTPYFRAAYVREFNEENDDVNVSLAAVPGSNFELQANATDSNYGNFGVGLAATLGQGFSEFVDYDVVAGHDNVTIHQVTAGVRFEY